MMGHSKRGAVAAVFFALAVLGGGANMTAQSQSNGVIFTGVFPVPLVAGGALKTKAGTLIHVNLKINNGSSPLRFSIYRSTLPELLDAAGAVVPFDYGANRSRSPRESDYPLLGAEQSLIILLDATMTLQEGQLHWKGSDGILGFWKITRSAGPYRFRLRYRQTQQTVGPREGLSGTLSGIWVGESTTATVELPLKFAH